MVTTFYMLVGLPGTGKSTWCDKFVRHNRLERFHETPLTGEHVRDNLTVVSTDEIIEIIAEQYRLTYNQVFDNITYSFAEKMSHMLVKYAFDRQDTVVWDQTNLTPKTRARKLELVPPNYRKIAVVFDVPDDLETRLSSRIGKTIPDHVMAGMVKSYRKPELSEGFDFIMSPSDIRLDIQVQLIYK